MKTLTAGAYGVLQLPDPTLWPFARYECGPDWEARRRPNMAGGAPLDPCRRAHGPVRHSNGVQSSLYVVYLKGVGLTGTSIGILLAATEITSGLGSLFAGRAIRLGDPQRTMLTGTVLSILLICATPFTGGIFALLFAAQALRGWLEGVVQPMM